MNDIGWAVQQLKRGTRVSRMSWNGSHYLVLGQDADGEPSVRAQTLSFDEPISWLATTTDLLATDWTVVLTGS